MCVCVFFFFARSPAIVSAVLTQLLEAGGKQEGVRAVTFDLLACHLLHARYHAHPPAAWMTERLPSVLAMTLQDANEVIEPYLC